MTEAFGVDDEAGGQIRKFEIWGSRVAFHPYELNLSFTNTGIHRY